jgi:type IV secretory pathway VirJ component
MTAFLKHSAIALFVCLLVLPRSAHADPAPAINGGRLGTVAYVAPQGNAVDVVILFANDIHDRDTALAASRLTALGAAVAIVDSQAYLATLAADKGECVWLSSDVEDLNRSLQRKLGFPDFRLPVLASLGKGGALVYGLLAEAPSYSFAGGVSVGFAPAAPGKINICGIGTPAADSRGEMPTVDVKMPWTVQPARSSDQEAVADWVDDVDNADLASPDATNTPDPQRLADLVKPLLVSAIAKDPNNLEDLPLIEMPTGKPSPYLVIIYSGDGGWRDLDRTLGQILQAHGVPVIGVDSLLYFWQPRRPEIVAHDLDRIIDHYHQAWKIDHFVLAGFSFGADILPFAYNRLTAENKALVSQVSLLALSRNTRFEISVSEYFSDSATSQTLPVVPELAQIPPGLVQCFYGSDEAADSGCTAPAAAKTELIETSGGHHFGEDYEAIAQRIIQGAQKRVK